MTAHDNLPRTAAAIQARRQTTQQMLTRLQDAITVLRRQKAPLSLAAIARRAGVSRTFLYENPEARSLATAAVDRANGHHATQQANLDEQHEASWRERALNAEDALKTAYQEIQTQRSRIAILLGQLRDLEQQWTEESLEHVTTENTTLKRRVRQLTQDNRTLEERLSAARSNVRFQDRKIAQLEVQVLDATSGSS